MKGAVLAAVLLLSAAPSLMAADTALGRGMTARLSEDWIVCSTREVAARLSIYVKEGDQFGMDSIIRHGLGVNVGEGTRVKILDSAGNLCEVRVISGIYNDYHGWISRDFLVH